MIGRIVRRTAQAAAIGLASLVMMAPLAGCSGGGQAKVAQLAPPGDMPEGADWTGVYYSPLFGYLHVVQEGAAVNARWMRPQKDRWGELHGEADGDLLKFTWSEYVVGGVGPNTKKGGKGYFRYSRPEGENVDDKIAGQLGEGADEVGVDWDAIKQRDQRPDIDSIGGSGSEDIGGGEWDKGNKEGGAPEEPAEPPP